MSNTDATAWSDLHKMIFPKGSPAHSESKPKPLQVPDRTLCELSPGYTPPTLPVPSLTTLAPILPAPATLTHLLAQTPLTRSYLRAFALASPSAQTPPPHTTISIYFTLPRCLLIREPSSTAQNRMAAPLPGHPSHLTWLHSPPQPLDHQSPQVEPKLHEGRVSHAFWFTVLSPVRRPHNGWIVNSCRMNEQSSVCAPLCIPGLLQIRCRNTTPH